jgi:two-component system NtrC family sensor kinase
MSECRLRQTKPSESAGRSHLGLRHRLWLPALVGALALVAALGTLGLLSLSNLRRLQPVDVHLALVSGLQRATQDLGLELARELRGEPSDLRTVRAELGDMTADPRLLADQSVEPLKRARMLIAEAPGEPSQALAQALGLLNGAWRSEMTAHTRLWAAAEASARREIHMAMVLVLVVGLLGSGLLVLMRGRILRPLRDVELLFARFTTGDVQPAPDGQADPLIRPLFSAYNALVCRLAGLEQERARREGRLRDEVRNATRALMQQTWELDRAARTAALGELAAELAHELRNPLAGIQMAVKRLRGELSDTRLTERLDLVMNELKRLSRLTDQLLERAQGTPEPAVDLDLATVVDEVLALAGYQVEKGLRLESAVPPDLHCVVPEGCLRQALLHLVLNAGQSMQGLSGEIRVEAGVHGGRLQIRVVDQGPGFPPPLLERGAPAGSWHSRGNGLGLTVVRRFARRLFGELRLANPEAGGALAIIDLPDSVVAKGGVR